MIFKKLHFFIVFCLVHRVIFSDDQVNFEQKYQTVLQKFSDLTNQDLEIQIHQMPQFFLHVDRPYKQIIKSVHQDFQSLHKRIKHLRHQNKSTEVLQILHDQLKSFYKFIKKYRLQYEIVMFHDYVKNYWSVLFQAVAQGKDVALFMQNFDIAVIDYEGLRQFIKIVNKDLRKIEAYEYRLHTDWIDLKLANYVLKIEFIRLRNAILFHPSYKKTKLKLSSNYPR